MRPIENLKDNAVPATGVRLKYRVMSIIKKASVALMALVLACGSALATEVGDKSNKTSGFNWNPVIEAIIQVESEGNPNAVSGNSVGVMQITPILVKECNEILKKQKSKKRYTMKQVLQESTRQDEIRKRSADRFGSRFFFVYSVK